MKRILSCLLAVLLSGGPVVADSRLSGTAIAGDTPVFWQTTDSRTARPVGVAPPLSVIFFAFKTGAGSAGVGEERWAEEAARHGVDVHAMKTVPGRSVHVNKAGRLARCTAAAIGNGFCPGQRILPLESRTGIARSVLEQPGRCRWTGFDGNLHERLALPRGAASFTLHVVADCR